MNFLEQFLIQETKRVFSIDENVDFNLVKTLAKNTGLTPTKISRFINNPQDEAAIDLLKKLSETLSIPAMKLVVDFEAGKNGFNAAFRELVDFDNQREMQFDNHGSFFSLKSNS